MWTRKMLKENAKASLKDFYWMALGICVLYSLIVSAASGIASSIPFGSIAVAIFFTNILAVGLIRYFYDAKWGDKSLSKLFDYFKSGRYGGVMKTKLLVTVYLFLWYCLFIVPGIIKNYEYRLVPYILAENPNIDSKRAFEISKKTMEGEKWDAFLLDASFWGWYILGGLCLGVGVYFVMPYYYATTIEFYLCMKEKALAYNFASPSDFGDTLYEQNSNTYEQYTQEENAPLLYDNTEYSTMDVNDDDETAYTNDSVNEDDTLQQEKENEA